MLKWQSLRGHSRAPKLYSWVRSQSEARSRYHSTTRQPPHATNGTASRLTLYISDANSFSLYIPSRLYCACFNFNPRLRYQLGARVLHIWNTRITLPLNIFIHLPSRLHSPSVTAPPAWTLLSHLPISPATPLMPTACCQRRFGMTWPLILEGTFVVRSFKPTSIAI